MNTTLRHELEKYRPVIILGKFLPRRSLKRLRFLFATLFALSLTVTWLVQHNLLSQTAVSTTEILALNLLFGALWIEQICLYAYHNWYYFRGLDSTIGQKGKTNHGITYDVAEIFLADEEDVTRSLLISLFGQSVVERLELPLEAVNDFLKSSRSLISSGHINLIPAQTTTLPDIAEQLYELDREWQNLLTQKGISKNNFLETVQFAYDLLVARKRSQRWWSRDSLSHTIGIGSELAFGDTPFVHRFSQPLLFGTIFSEHTGSTQYTTHYAKKVLEVLASHSASNVLIVGPVGVGKMDIVYTVADLLTYGKGLHSLHGHHVVVTDIEHLFSSAQDDKTLEEHIIHYFDEALQAGNVTLVIPSLHTFIKAGEEHGLMITDLLNKYLAHPQLHIIAVDVPEESNLLLQNHTSILRHFETIVIEPANHADTINILKSVTNSLEKETGKIISLPALLQVEKSADRYLVDGVMPDRAVALLENIFNATEKKVINHAAVVEYLSSTIGINVGPLSGGERDQLLNLENTLTTMVVGQSHAVGAIANTLRRVRIDTTRADKPKGSFLFLGPTGVGKTALAKALALVYSKSEGAMVRFDMSEFSQPDALGYFIGDKETSGLLTKQLHDHPFSIILFDEFEKAHSTIHDLFLQILDEGYFTNAQGKKVNARNTIIIATSNAGSTLISQMSDSPVLMEEIRRHLIDNNIYRPELLNRFDETIIFNPLTVEASRYIIQKNLADLTTRLSQDGYRLSLDDKLTDVLLEKGFSPEFGARPLQRAIQDLVEAEVARQIILKNIKPGGKVKVTYEMIAEKASR